MAGNPTVTIYKDTTEALDLVPVKEGNILFDTNKKNIFVDDEDSGQREPYGANQNASGIYAKDTYGVIGIAGENVTAQQLLDYSTKQSAANEVDDTLTKEGQAADAKVVGDKFNTVDGRLTQLNSDITKTILTNTDLNNFVSEDKPRWGYGYNFTNSPFTAGCTVEYIPYGPDYGVQRVTQVQADGGTYKTAKRIKDNGIWQSWVVDNPRIWNKGSTNVVTDCNAATENNVTYVVYGTAANRPFENDTWYILWAHEWDDLNCIQFGCVFGTTQIWARFKNNGEWGEWKELIGA